MKKAKQIDRMISSCLWGYSPYFGLISKAPTSLYSYETDRCYTALSILINLAEWFVCD